MRVAAIPLTVEVEETVAPTAPALAPTVAVGLTGVDTLGNGDDEMDND